MSVCTSNNDITARHVCVYVGEMQQWQYLIEFWQAYEIKVYIPYDNVDWITFVIYGNFWTMTINELR